MSKKKLQSKKIFKIKTYFLYNNPYIFYSLNRKISGYLIRKQKVQAKYSLRQKKNLEKILSKRMDSLNSIEGILLKIQGAASDSEVRDNILIIPSFFLKKKIYIYIYII